MRWHAGSRTLWVGDRGWAAEPVARRGETYAVPVVPGCTAQISLRPDGRAELDLWTAEPNGSKAVAVLAGRERPVALTVVPTCECGEPECGNVGVQLVAVDVTEDDLNQLLDTISGLRWRGAPPRRGDTIWQPD